MQTNQESNDSLIDWTSPPIEQQSSRPLIPLPVFSSPLSDVDVDNPFDALERQINDDALDLLNVSSPFGSNENSPTGSPREQKHLIESPTSEMLICLDDDDLPKSSMKKTEPPRDDLAAERRPLSLLEMSTISSISDNNSDIRVMVVNRISNCISRALNSIGKDISKLDGSFRLNEGFVSEASGNEQEWRRERSRSLELSWGGFDVDEDLRSIAMPTWNDMLSSEEEDESTAKRLSRSLPIEGTELRMKKKASIQMSKMNTGMDNKLNKLQANQKALCSNKDKVTSTLLLKQKRWYAPIASSTPQTRKSSLAKRNSQISSYRQSRSSLRQEENNSRAPSPDSTSNVESIRETKITPKTRVPKVVPTRKSSSFPHKKTNSSRNPLTNKSLNKSTRDKENTLPFKI